MHRSSRTKSRPEDRFSSLVSVMVKMFRSLKDVDHLFGHLRMLFPRLLSLITECCLLMRNHIRHSFASEWLSNERALYVVSSFFCRSLIEYQ